MKIAKNRCTALFLLMIIGISFFGRVPLAKANFEGYSARCVDDSTSNSKSSDTSSGTNSGVGGNWTQEGSQAYIWAKGIFDYWTKKRGFSGAAAAGAVGNAGNESGLTFDPQIVQGGGRTDNPKTVTGAVGTHGYGIYQISPGANYGNWGGFTEATVENESDYVWEAYNGAAVSGGLKNNGHLSELANAATPEDGTWLWFHTVELAAQSQSSYDRKANRENIARKAYEMFGGADIPANSALFGAATTADIGQQETKAADSSDCATPIDSNNIVEVAKTLIGYFTYQQVHGEHYIGSVDSPDKNGITDCSGFVWLVLAKAGYKVPENMGWFTMTMEQDAKGPHKYLEEVSPDEAKAGDIVIVNTGDGSGSAGHTAILEEKWKGGDPKNNSTKIIQMGGRSDKEGVNEDHFNTSFTSLLDGGTITLARAIKK